MGRIKGYKKKNRKEKGVQDDENKDGRVCEC